MSMKEMIIHIYMQTEVCDGTMDSYVQLFWQDGWGH